MSDVDPTIAETKDRYIDGLRRLADYLETTKLDLSYEFEMCPFKLDVFTWREDDYNERARALGGFREKLLEGSFAVTRRSFGPHTIDVNISRETVCERVKVGEVVVPASEERVEDVFEWRCPEYVAAANISAPGGDTTPAGVLFPPDPTDAPTSAGAGAENVIPIGHSVRVPINPADAYPVGDYKHPDAGRIA